MEKVSLKPFSKSLKFVALAVVSAAAVLLANHYYEIYEYEKQMSSQLSITVFIDKACQDGEQVCDALNSLGLVSVGEYVSAESAYTKAIEKNPFLKEISVPGDTGYFQSYVKAFPSKLPTDEYLVIARNAMAEVKDVDEIVFDKDGFRQYVQAKNFLTFYRDFALIFALAIFFLFIVQSALFIAEKEQNYRKLITNVLAYLLAAAGGFLAVWCVCQYIQYPLLVGEKSIFLILSITAALGIIFKD